MVHNGIEYGIMAAYAEGLGILRSANIGKQEGGIDAETTPLGSPNITYTTSISRTLPRSGDPVASSRRGCWTSQLPPCSEILLFPRSRGECRIR